LVAVDLAFTVAHMAAAVATATTAACTTAGPGWQSSPRAWEPPAGEGPPGRGSTRTRGWGGGVCVLNKKNKDARRPPPHRGAPKRGGYRSALTLDQILAAESLYTINGGRLMSNARRRWRRNCF